MSQGRSLELYFVDGQPDGMLTAEVFNWTGHVLRNPRTQPARASLNEAARANMESFLDTLDMVLPAIGIDIADKTQTKQKTNSDNNSNANAAIVFEIIRQKHNIRAKAQFNDGKMILLTGSHVRKDWSNVISTHASIVELHQRLVDQVKITLTAEYAKSHKTLASTAPPLRRQLSLVAMPMAEKNGSSPMAGPMPSGKKLYCRIWTRMNK